MTCSVLVEDCRSARDRKIRCGAPDEITSRCLSSRPENLERMTETPTNVDSEVGSERGPTRIDAGAGGADTADAGAGRRCTTRVLAVLTSDKQHTTWCDIEC